MEKCVFDQIGGAVAVDAAVDIFYRKVLTDSTISHFFDSVDMDDQEAKQKAFLTMAFGGPNEYTGKDMRTAHAGLVSRGLNDRHFDAVCTHLKETLEELGVPESLMKQILHVAESVRDDVLNR